MICWACQSDVGLHIDRCPYCGVTTHVQNVDPWVGRKLGVYELVRCIGQGGMGVVYEAHHPHLQMSYALKALHPSLSEDWVMVERLRREAIVAFQLQHKNIVQVLDYGWDQELGFYLVMELLRGEGLHTLLVRQPVLPLLRVAQVVYQICDALSVAHGHGVIHRDLKPGNVFLVEDLDGREQVKLLDFGIARWLDTQGQYELTRAGKSFGTPAYMPPEQILSRSDEITPATDLYALAAMVYRMLTGVLPFKGGNTIDTLHQVMTSPAPLISRVRKGLAGTALEDLLVRCMSKESRERIQSAQEFSTEFQQALLEPKVRDFLRHDQAERIIVEHQDVLAVETVGLPSAPLGHDARRSSPFSQLSTQRVDPHDGVEPPQRMSGQGGVLLYPISREQQALGALETMSLEDARMWLQQMEQDAPTQIKGQSLQDSLRESVAQILSSLPENDRTTKLNQPPVGLREYTPPGRQILQEALSAPMPTSVPKPSSQPPTPPVNTKERMIHQATSSVPGIPKAERVDTSRLGVVRSKMDRWRASFVTASKRRSWKWTGLIVGGFCFGFLLVGMVLWWRQTWQPSETFSAGNQETQVFSSDFQSGLISEFYYLRIESEPSQARVIEQGNLLGSTPLTIRRRRGKVLNFVLEKPGYELSAGSWAARHDQRVTIMLQSRTPGTQ